MSEDIKICLCKTLKLLSHVCVTSHPILSLSTLCMFLLYVACPFAFWVLVHSVPLVVCTAILIAFSFQTGNKDLTTNKRSITRVHSVRQRRAKEFVKENENTRHVEGKNELFSAKFSREENSSKEIQEVEVALVSGTKMDKSNVIRTNKVVMEEKEEGDRKVNKIDDLISDNERSKRLESLIARRRLMNKGRNWDLEVTSIDIPKIKNMSRLFIPRSDRGVQPSPGSAPSVLTALRSPFDLPYDPQEEKPDLTGDDFEQEFMPANNKDMMMFSRHESFFLKPFLPGEFNRSLKEISFSVPESRIRRGASCSQLHQSSLPAAAGTQHGREFITTGSSQPITNEDQEKSSDSDSTSEEETPVFKIDREAILRSLSIMAQRTPPLEKPELYYTDRPTPTTKRDPSSNSIASDMQVEVSELGSPPLTIDENLSYVYNDDESRSICDAESWAGSSHFDYSQVDEYESRLPRDERIGSSRGDFPEETTILNENQCDHPWCSTAEYHSNCRTPRATTLEEKIEKTLQRSVSLTAKSSLKPEECSHRFNKSEGSNSLDAVTGSTIIHENNTETVEDTATVERTVEEGRLLNERHDTENSAAQSLPPSEETQEPEYQERVMGSTIVEDQVNLGSTQNSEGDQSSGVSNSDQDQEQSPNMMPNAALELAQSSPSPKSVLRLTCSLASLDHYIDDEVHAVDARGVRGLSPVEHTGSGDLQGIEHESSEPSNDDTESAKQGESSQVHSGSEDEAEETDEISLMPFTIDDEASSKENLTAPSHSTDQLNDSSPPLSADEEEQSRREEIRDDGNGKPSDYEVLTETSALHEDKGDS